MSTRKAKVAKTDSTEDAGAACSGAACHADNKQHSMFIAALCNAKVDQVRCDNNVVFCADRSDKVVDVFKGMLKHGFMAVPVLTKTEKTFFAWIDMMDIVRKLVELFGQDKLGKDGADFWKMHEADERFQKLAVDDVLKWPHGRENVFHPVASGFSLFHATELLARVQGLHRVPIVNTDFKVVSIITQTRLLEIVRLNMESVGLKREKPVRDVVRSQGVVSVNENRPAIEAFETMVRQNITGMAVVNDDGKCVGALSLSDIKNMGEDGRLFWRLFQTVKNYIVHLRQDFSRKYNRPRTLVSVKLDSTLEEAASAILDNKIHHVFVVDDDSKPVSVVSIRDILLELISS